MRLIINQKNQPLPEPYQSLAQLRLKQSPIDPENPSYRLISSFAWDKTKEDHDWWSRVHSGDCPEIPESSLKELNLSNPKPKKHSTMEDVFKGINRHAKKE